MILAGAGVTEILGDASSVGPPAARTLTQQHYIADPASGKSSRWPVSISHRFPSTAEVPARRRLSQYPDGRAVSISRVTATALSELPPRTTRVAKAISPR